MEWAHPPDARHGASRRVVVAAYTRPVEAHLARARLEAAGISCELADEHIVGVQWLYASAVGGVKLRVWEEDRADALSLLQEVVEPRPSGSARWITADLDAPRCPHCGCLDLRPAPSGPWLLAASILLLGLPLAFVRSRMRCSHCGRLE